MLLLRSNRSFGKVVEFDPVNVGWRELVTDNLSGNEPRKANGFFDFLGGEFVAIFLLEGYVVVQVGGKSFPLDSTEILVEGGVSSRKLHIKATGQKPLVLSYSLVNEPKFKDDPTAFVDDEDFDFGLFIANIASSQSRQKVIAENW